MLIVSIIPGWRQHLRSDEWNCADADAYALFTRFIKLCVCLFPFYKSEPQWKRGARAQVSFSRPPMDVETHLNIHLHVHTFTIDYTCHLEEQQRRRTDWLCFISCRYTRLRLFTVPVNHRNGDISIIIIKRVREGKG